MTAKSRRPRRTAGKKILYTITSKGTKIENLNSWRHDPEFFFGLFSLSSTPFGVTVQQTLTYSVFYIENYIVNNIGGWAIVLIGVVVTAGFVPNMMQKGSVDLLLVKPIHRPTLLLFKYLGGLTFVLLNSLIAIGGVWLVLGLRTGIWAPAFLLTPFIVTFFFAIIYSVSTVVGVLTRSTLMCILMTSLFWGFLFVLGQADAQLNPRQSAGDVSGNRSTTLEVLTRGVGAVQTVLPRTNDLGKLTTRLLRDDVLPPAEQAEYRRQARKEREIFQERRQKQDEAKEEPEDPSEVIHWGEALPSSLAFIAVMLGLACWRFTVQDS